MKTALTKEERFRYARQIAVEELGAKGQERLFDSKVLIIGCGALGSMVAMQLAGAGVGTIGIADYDSIDISNLQRQFFFETSESGFLKTTVLEKRIKDLNPGVAITVYNTIITNKLATEIFPQYDFIVDATDNPDSKRMTGQISKDTGKACSIGGVRNFYGQVMTLLPADPRLEDYFGNATSEGFLPCSLGGVMGPAAALCASIQACETIKFLTGIGTVLSGNIILFNLLDNSFKTLKL